MLDFPEGLLKKDEDEVGARSAVEEEEEEEEGRSTKEKKKKEGGSQVWMGKEEEGKEGREGRKARLTFSTERVPDVAIRGRGWGWVRIDGEMSLLEEGCEHLEGRGREGLSWFEERGRKEVERSSRLTFLFSSLFFWGVSFSFSLLFFWKQKA